MKARIHIITKEAVLDPEGKAIKIALNNLGFSNIEGVRQGKYIEIDIQSTDYEKTKKDINLMCEKLLANTIIEDFEVELV
tara:strand:+ start:567 stop:806 length:240 start_codon:yes stop_codon:yes gene_type:complete